VKDRNEYAVSEGMLLVMMEPPAVLEDEFNDWYDTEHFPQRAALPGFTSASRWACIEGWPKWLALYDLESVDCLNSAAYLQVSGQNGTPWSKRLLPRTVGRSRVVGSIVSADCAYGRLDQAAQQLLFCWHVESRSLATDLALSICKRSENLKGIQALRIFAAENKDGVNVWAVFGLSTVSRPQEMICLIEQSAGNARAVLFNRYVPYVRYRE
jgi:hypothetical protein